MRGQKVTVFLSILFCLLFLSGCDPSRTTTTSLPDESEMFSVSAGNDNLSDNPSGDVTSRPILKPSPSPMPFDLGNVPIFDSEHPYTEINGNYPFFLPEELTTEPFETYSPLDSLGRCGVAFANVCMELMPTEERSGIGMVKPAGWHTQRYDDLIEGKYLYNRCHLIGYQLTGENANVDNLITGTRYFNVEGMLPLENEVAEYVQSTGHHVLYRVTPIYEGDNLLANGLLMEAYSVEDDGAGVCFCNYVYNAQPYIEIDYATGESSVSDNAPKPTSEPTPESTPKPTPEPEQEPEQETSGTDYIANTNTGKFHYPYCSSVDRMKESNKLYFTGSRESLIEQGYVPCKRCDP